MSGVGSLAAAAASVCAGGAAWFACSPRAAVRTRAVLGGVDVGRRPGSGDTSASGASARQWWSTPPGVLKLRFGSRRVCLVPGALLALALWSPVPLLLGGIAVPVLRRVRRARAANVDRNRRTEAVIALCGLLAGEMRAGRQPAAAIAVAAEESGGLGVAESSVLAAARFGGDVPAALTRAADQPGAEGLAGLGACWQVAVDRGAGLQAGVRRLEQALRAEQTQRAELEAQLAGARSTVVLLAALPALGLALGSAIGARPLRVLVHTAPGLACLAVGLCLETAGLWWANNIVRKAEKQ